jgi:murein L,D-transpeptidase YafK
LNFVSIFKLKSAKNKGMRLFIVLLGCLVVLPFLSFSQGTAAANANFVEYQKKFPRINAAYYKKLQNLQKEFSDKNLAWPARYIYIRSFKYDSELEVWVKYQKNESFKLFKTYKVCALAGTLGPKRLQGDFQVPEGFYYVNEFNPKSMYHLSLGLNYPNASDKVLSDAHQPGGDIYIHGSCVTTGCIPITDNQIEDLYILAAHAINEGQDFIPVHIFPIRFDVKRSVDYLNNYARNYPEYRSFVQPLKEAYDYFNMHADLPLIMVNRRGEYVVQPLKETFIRINEPIVPVHVESPVRINTFPEDSIAKVVDQLPQFQGGYAAFQKFLDKLSNDMKVHMSGSFSKTYLTVEYIVDQKGKVVFAEVTKGGNKLINEKVVDAFEALPRYTPARRLGRDVAMRLTQGIDISL